MALLVTNPYEVDDATKHLGFLGTKANAKLTEQFMTTDMLRCMSITFPLLLLPSREPRFAVNFACKNEN
jgi:hypothetical protein